MSSPAAPRIRLGPRFAAVNDVDRDVEEALGLEPEVLPEPRFEVEEAEPATSAMEEMEVDTKVGVDEEIDELLSETEEPVVKENSGGWKCRWDDCWKDQDSQEILVEHLQTGEFSSLSLSRRGSTQKQNISVKEEKHMSANGICVLGRGRSKPLDIHSSLIVEPTQEKDHILVKNMVSLVIPSETSLMVRMWENIHAFRRIDKTPSITTQHNPRNTTS